MVRQFQALLSRVTRGLVASALSGRRLRAKASSCVSPIRRTIAAVGENGHNSVGAITPQGFRLMTRVRVAAAVLNQTPLDWDGQPAEHPRRHRKPRESAGVAVLCLPELCITGYGCEDAFHGRGLQ